MKKRIILHLTAVVVLMPCLWVNLLGIIYIGYLAILLNESDAAKRFVRRYYHEILRLQNML